jgi:chemotaxis protein MotB
MKKEKKTEEIDSSAWMVTFTNLMILLLAFFIVMVNMASLISRRKKRHSILFLGSFGHLPGGQSPIGGKDGTDITMADSPFSRVEVEFENLRNVTSTNGLDSDVDIRMESERIILSLSNRILFEHGDYAITEKSGSLSYGNRQGVQGGSGYGGTQGLCRKK